MVVLTCTFALDSTGLKTKSIAAGWCWIIGKPSRKGPGAAWFRKFVERCRRGEYEDGEAFTLPAWDILPAAEIEQMRSTMELQGLQ